MAFCAHCGSPVSGNFCGTCGKSIETPSPGPPAGPSQPPAEAGEMAENLACTLAYIPCAGLVIGIIFLAVAPYNQKKKVRFDAWQSVLLHLAWIVAVTIVNVLFPWHVANRLDPLLHLAWVILLVFLMWKAYQNEKVVLPLIGPLADKQA